MRFHLLVLWTLMLMISAAKAQDTSQQIIPNRRNSIDQQQKPYVILISADGFRHDFADKYAAKNLIKLRQSGVAAASMIPSFPSLTFPNHYTIVTGLYPAHHGLVENNFYDKKRQLPYSDTNKKEVVDGKWYGGTPLWNLAEQQQMLAASFYWVAAEADIQGMKQTYYYNYNTQISIDDRIKTVKDWLQLPPEKRPHLITFYFPQVDHQAHNFGPESAEAAEAVKLIDESIGKLVKTIDSLSLPVNYIFVSDHGMTKVDYKNPLPLPPVVDTSKLVVPNGNALLQLYAKNIGDINPTYAALKKSAKNYDVYLKKNLPAHWHYGFKDDKFERVGDILLIPKLPFVFNISNKAVTMGKHGFDPQIKDMQAVFYAWGPLFKKNQRIPSFENIHVYPLIANILGLTIDSEIDGSLDILKEVLITH
jgi:predicted AlkP superfamily pyrophosphatase or phosphodiesterase